MAPSWATHLADLQVLQALFRTRTGDPSLPSSDEAGHEGKRGKPRARKLRKEAESADNK
jgi:hypothetical protein